jgi:hypothetical protein
MKIIQWTPTGREFKWLDKHLPKIQELSIDVLVWFFHFLLVNVFSNIFSLFRNIIMWNSLRLLWREKSQPVPGAPKKACFALLNFSCPAQPGENHWPVASHWLHFHLQKDFSFYIFTLLMFKKPNKTTISTQKTDTFLSTYVLLILLCI